ncbi:MAG: hypothetical protein ACK5IC_10875, partial [Moheibacter sp.]
LIGYTKGNTEFGAMQQMHVYGGSSLITAKDKIEYKAPDMNKLPEIGNFEYDKEPTVVDVFWMDTPLDKEMKNVCIGEKVRLMAQTRNHKEGDSVKIDIEEKNGDKIEKATYTGTVNADGFAELEEEIEIKSIEEEKMNDSNPVVKDELSQFRDAQDPAYHKWLKEQESKKVNSIFLEEKQPKEKKGWFW